LAEEGAHYYAHLTVRGHVENREFRQRGGGNPKVRDIERRAHGRAMKGQLDAAIAETDERRAALEPSLEELNALGSVVVLEGADPACPLKVDSLEALSRHRKVPKRPQWLLLSVTPGDGDTLERASVWISDEYRQAFLGRFEAFLEKDTPTGKPQNRELVANVGRIRTAVLMDLWQSAGEPPKSGKRWWELWLRDEPDALELTRAYAQALNVRLVERSLRLSGRAVVWIEASWDQLQALPFTSVPLAEIRRPEFVETIEDLGRDEQEELAADLADRVRPAALDAPAVCHLDTGVRRSHELLRASLDQGDVHTIVGGSLADRAGHGTPMAGLALYGPLDDPLLSAAEIRLRHRLESVKFLPDDGQHEPETYGMVTAQAVAAPEAVADRPRVFCMPITTEPDRPGEPSLWSAAVDALAAGVDIASDEKGISLLGAPDPDASRLIVVSAGNVDRYEKDYLTACDLAPIEDPAHAWNALTVGAHTELIEAPSDPSFAGWTALAARGEISPHSRTSVSVSGRAWPAKPDICMEGGNVLFDGTSDFHERHPVLSLPTTDSKGDLALGSLNATSASTAQAARLAALAQATYPAFWPETLKGLLVHSAEWTPAMRSRFDGTSGKSGRLSLLRRYGWGVPSEEAVLGSTKNAVTMVKQDEFVPFEGEDFKARVFRLHTLPWPAETLHELGAADVTMKVTLAYFIEPTAARRGWRQKYAYRSHGLRFELKGATETMSEFLAKLNFEAQAEEEGRRTSGGSNRWVLGKNQRNNGSLHQDIWQGSGAELASKGVLAIHPVGGWWKNNKRKDRIDRGTRYALIVSLRTAEEGVDLYTPVAVQLDVPVEAAIVAT